jgi:hypothetical protein
MLRGFLSATVWCMLLAVVSANAVRAADAAADASVWEMRVYYAAPGKLDALHARFRDHTTKLFAKHGMTNVGYFVPAGDNPEGKLVYFLRHASAAAADASWKAFLDDPDWKQVHAASEKDGKLVDRIVSRRMRTTDYSPQLPTTPGKAGRAIELRTYTTTAGNLPALNARFREHTMGLFAKHGMTNLIYWNFLPDQPHADRMLVYLLAHDSVEAAQKSFGAFRQDPVWIQAKAASEEKAGGSLTEKENGVVSEFLVPTDYSTLR